MAHDSSRELLQTQYEQVHQSEMWREFRDIRANDWDPLIRRQSEENFRLLAETYGIEAAIESPVLEEDLHERIAILLSNSAKIDALSLDTSKPAKKRVEDMRIWAAASWVQQDEGHELSREIYEAMIRYGVWYGFKTWQEPDAPDLLPQEEGESEAAYAQRALKSRDQQVNEAGEQHCFGREYVHPLSMAHWPLTKPTLYLQEIELPYVEARQLVQDRDPMKALRLNKNGDLIFGEPQLSDEVAPNQWTHASIKLLRRAMYDEEGEIWYVSEWARKDGDGIDKAQKLDEYPCPFGRSPYFFAAPRSLTTETTPHLRYRPMNYALITKVQELNTYRTLLLKRTLFRLSHPYGVITFHGVQADAMQTFLNANPDFGQSVMQGAGAERKLTWRVPPTEEGDVPIVPQLDPLPSDDVEALMQSIQMVNAEILELRANRFLVGGADIGQGPSTSLLDQHQAARTPFAAYHEAKDLAGKEWLEAEFRALCYWSNTSGLNMPLKMYARGDEPVARDPHGDAEVISITAEKIEAQPYVLSMITANESDQEVSLRQQTADVAYAQHAITREEWLRQRGSSDPETEIEALEEERAEQMMQPYADQVLQQMIKSFYSAFSGLNLEVLTNPAALQGATGGTPQPQQQGGGTGLVPAEQPQIQPAYPKPGVMSGTAPLVPGPRGGNLPTAGGLG